MENKTTHEMLYEICEKIGYTKFNKGIFFELNSFYKYDLMSEKSIIVDEREIIFTQEFIDLYAEYFRKKMGHISFSESRQGLMYELSGYLDNPTLYLYNLLELGTINQT